MKTGVERKEYLPRICQRVNALAESIHQMSGKEVRPGACLLNPVSRHVSSALKMHKGWNELYHSFSRVEPR